MADEKESDINSRIPPELLSIIFQFLPFSDLKHALLVCKRWRDLGEQPSLWAKLELQFEGTKEVELHQVLAMNNNITCTSIGRTNVTLEMNNGRMLSSAARSRHRPQRRGDGGGRPVLLSPGW